MAALIFLGSVKAGISILKNENGGRAAPASGLLPALLELAESVETKAAAMFPICEKDPDHDGSSRYPNWHAVPTKHRVPSESWM